MYLLETAFIVLAVLSQIRNRKDPGILTGIYFDYKLEKNHQTILHKNLSNE